MNTAAEYIADLLADSADEGTCPVCANEGVVMTRHEELDTDLLAEVWMDDYCDCRAGHRREEQDLDTAEENGL